MQVKNVHNHIRLIIYLIQAKVSVDFFYFEIKTIRFKKRDFDF